MPDIDEKQFWRRFHALHKRLLESPAQFGNADVLLIVNGARDESVLFRKTLALLLWMVGYEIYDTALIITKSGLHVLASKTKTKMFERLESKHNNLTIKCITLEKNADSSAKLKLALKAISTDQRKELKLGMILKDAVQGGVMENFMKLVKEVEAWECVDSSFGISEAIAIRSSAELESVRAAAAVSCAVLDKKVLSGVEDVIDSETSTKHSELTDKVETFLDTAGEVMKILPKRWQKLDEEDIEPCFSPIVMSGGSYTLKPSAVSDDEPLHAGVVIISTGFRYRSICSCLSRTYFIDPDHDQKAVYAVLMEVRDACIKALKPQSKASHVWAAAIKIIKSRRPELAGSFVKNVGFLTGFEFRDLSFVLNAKNDRVIQPGMVFVLMMGFNGLKKKDGQGRGATYAVMLSDTVVVDREAPEVCTLASKPDFKNITYYLTKEDDQDSDDLDAANFPLSLQVDGDESGPRTRGTRNAKRVAQNAAQLEMDEKRKRMQAELAEKKQALAAKKYASDQIDKEFDMERNLDEVAMSYTSPKKFPADAQPNRITVDVQSESVLMPICGLLVPFHINMIKSVSQYEQSGFTYLRVNMYTPGPGTDSQVPSYADKSQKFIKEVTFRASDGRNLSKTLRLVKELQRRIKQREKESIERKHTRKQPEIQLNTDKRFEFRLRDLQVRPGLGGKKLQGTLTTHQNGFLFLGNKGQKLPIIYSNIKNAFFQPADNTISVLLHFDLHSPIMCGKKRTNYVQFYYEVVDSSQDLAGLKRGYHDRDGIQEEQQEKIKRNRANERFRSFARQAEDVVEQLDPENKFEFDIPYKDLMFPGVPNKSSVMVMPTVHGLVALDDAPPFVMSLDDIEIAYFERVQFSLKNFDLVFIFKDFDRPVVKIRTIPIDHLSAIQQYLTDSSVVYYVGTMSLQWPRILKTIKTDAKYFFTEQGGWASILAPDSDDENDVEEDVDSEFEPDESEVENEEDSEEYESDDVDEDEEESEYEEEEDAGPSWEELEEEAIREERRRTEGSDDDRPAKKRKHGRR